MSIQGGGRGAPGILGLPNAGENDEFHSDEAKGTVRQWFVDQRFGFGLVQSAGRDTRAQYKMYSHRAEIRTADARRRLREPGGERGIDVPELRRCLVNFV